MGDVITKLKSSEDLLKNLRDARKPTSQEVREQRVSFVFGALDSKSPITRDQVREMLESN